MWCIPPTANAEFVYHMEDVLDVYHRPSDPQGTVNLAPIATRSHNIQTAPKARSAQTDIENDF